MAQSQQSSSSSREQSRKEDQKQQDKKSQENEGQAPSLLGQQKANISALMKDRRENPPGPSTTDDGEPANLFGFPKRPAEDDGPYTGIADLARRLHTTSGDLVVNWNSRGDKWREDKLKEMKKLFDMIDGFEKAEPGIYELSEQTGYRPEDPRQAVQVSADEVGAPELRTPGEHKGVKG